MYKWVMTGSTWSFQTQLASGPVFTIQYQSEAIVTTFMSACCRAPFRYSHEHKGLDFHGENNIYREFRFDKGLEDNFEDWLSKYQDLFACDVFDNIIEAKNLSLSFATVVSQVETFITDQKLSLRELANTHNPERINPMKLHDQIYYWKQFIVSNYWLKLRA